MSSPNSSPKRSKSKGKDRERSRSPSRLRASKGAKKKTKDMSLEEMIDRVKKFGKLNMDAKTGVGTLEVNSKRLMGEDIGVLVDVFKRYTEVQHIRLQKCFLTDDLLERLFEGGLKGLRHLKSLWIGFNMLTERSSKFLIEKFSKLPRQLQHLDMRSNSLSEENAEELYHAFPNLQTLNEIQVYKYKRDLNNNIVDCHALQLKLPEMKILVCLLQQLGHRCHLHTLDLSNNLISAKGLKVLAEGIRLLPVQELDISYNPCTDGDLDFSGIDALYLSIHRHKYIARLCYEGVSMPEEYMDSLMCSMQVNKQLLPAQKNDDGVIKDKFATYIYDVVAQRTEPLPFNHYKDMQFDYVVDKNFCKFNRAPATEVTMHKFNRGFDLFQKQDERARIKHDI